jgi:hypothetical protein
LYTVALVESDRAIPFPFTGFQIPSPTLRGGTPEGTFWAHKILRPDLSLQISFRKEWL